MTNKRIKVIFDTNVWISFLIGKSLSRIKNYIADGSIIVITTKQLLSEIEIVTSREKFKKYFQRKNVKELIDLLETIGNTYKIEPTHLINRDPKDNFLFDLIDASKADFLVTGDKDLLEHDPFKTARILTPGEFDNLLKGK